jgi:membrane-bound serine protease (ClpP class)
LLSAGTVKSVAELLAQVGLPGAAVVPVQPYGFEVLARWLTMLSPVLVMIGFVAIYLELKTPGLGVPTVVAVICFGLYFIGYIAAGLAGWEEAVLFAVGLALLAVEVFVLPGFGVAGVAGLACILAALVLAMVEHFPGGPRWPAWSQVQGPLVTVLLEFAGSVVVMMLLARFLPETRLFRKMELAATTSGYKTAGATAAVLRGATGVAETPLRPAGKGRFNGQLVDVVTEGDWIEKGASIRITLVEGSRVVVTRGSCGTK